MEQNRFRYLSVRVMALLIAALCLTLFLTGVCLVQAFRGNAPFWPGIMGAVLLLLSIWAFSTWILRPYLQLERTMHLFLDGYTTTGLTDLCQVAPTPMVYRMLEHMMKIMDSSELLKLNKRQAQYLALQNQINPHFLYNTLESIRSEALIAGLTSVADMTEALATFFRYTISKVENLVSVEEELENCRTYFPAEPVHRMRPGGPGGNIRLPPAKADHAAYSGEQHHPWHGVQDRHRTSDHPAGTERETAADTYFRRRGGNG